MTKANNLIGYFMHKFSDKSVQPKFNLFAEIVLAIGNLTDEELDRIMEDKKDYRDYNAKGMSEIPR